MAFHKLFVPNFLTPDFFVKLDENFQWLQENVLSWESKAVSIQRINSISVETLPQNILPFFNAVEANIQEFKSKSHYCDLYFKRFEWKPLTVNKKAEVQRWVDWMNAAHDNFIGMHLEYLEDINGERIQDINGQDIQTVERG